MAKDNIVKVKALIEELERTLEEHNKTLDTTTSFISKLNQEYAKNPLAYTKGLKERLDLEKKLLEVRKKSIDIDGKVEIQRGRIARANAAENREKVSAIALEQKQIIAKERAIRISKRQEAQELKLASAYAQLRQKLTSAEQKYRDLAASLGTANTQTRKAQTEVLKLRNQVDAINKPIKRWNDNVGNYATGLRNIAGALGWAGVTYAMLNGVKATFETIKTYDVLFRALEQVTGSQQAFTAELQFLNEISENYGLNLQQTTRDYTKFLASAKETTLTLSEQRQIFRSVSKASASLGLSADDTSGTLRALNQIMSKGKVQAEELRGQLGERIPGAFQIMAKSMGVTTQELDKMLEQGQVLADEVLPAFAAEMERSFGIENLERIETLNGSINRLGNAWDRFVTSIDNGQGIISKAFKGLIEITTTFVNTLKMINVGFESTMRAEIFIEQSKILKESNMSLEQASSMLRVYRRNIELTEEKLNSLHKLNVTGRNDLKLELGDLKGRADAYREYIEFLTKGEDKIKSESQSTKENTKAVKDNNDEIQRLLELYAMLEEAENKLFGRKKIETELSIIDNDTDDIDLDVNERMLRGLAAMTESTYKDMQKSFDKYLSDNEGKYVNDYEAFMEFTKLKKIDYEKMLEGLRESTRKYLSNISQDFINNSPLSGLIPFADGTFSQLIRGAEELDKKLGDKAGIISNKFAVTFNSITEAAQQAFAFIDSFSQSNFDAQYQRLEQQRDVAIQFAGESTTAQAEIERQYEARRAEVQRRQAKAQQDQALFSVGVDTAQAIVATLAKTPPPKGLPLAALMASIGLAQAVAIKSQQIPQFWAGGEHMGGMLMMNDDPFGVKGSNYKEVAETPSGKIITPQGKNVKMNLPKGTIIHPTYDAFMNSLNQELTSNNIMAIGQPNIPPMIINQGLSKRDIKEVFGQEIGKLNTTIKNRKGIQIINDKRGQRIYETKQGQRSLKMNARYSGTGLNV